MTPDRCSCPWRQKPCLYRNRPRSRARRKIHMRRWRALAIAPVAAMLLTGTVLAQDGTPEADSSENPRLVDPSECVIEPRSSDEVAGILQLSGSTPVPQPDQISIVGPLG